MADTVVIAESVEDEAFFRFSWGVAIAGGIAAAAVTLVLLMLGAGFGLLLVSPAAHAKSGLPVFLTGGGLYFLVAVAFGFAVGGHIAGRMLGPVAESAAREDFRAASHGLVAWAVAIMVTLLIMAFAGATAATTGAATAALYGAAPHEHILASTSYFVDKLLRPVPDRRMSSADVSVDAAARAEAGRILDVSVMHDRQMTPDDHDRLVDLVAARTGLSHAEAAARVDTFQGAVLGEAHTAFTAVRRTASYASLWLAFSLIFGAVVSMASAVFARIEDDRDAGYRRP